MSSRRFHRFALAISGVFALFVVMGWAGEVMAQPLDVGLEPIEQTINLTSTDPRIIVGRIVQVALGVIGIVSVAIILYGGFVWMTSGGEQEKINQAKRIMINWGIGLIIILLAFSIVTFVLRLFGYDTAGLFGGGRTPFTFGRGALGNGIIESHYPPRGAHCSEVPPGTAGCIARNTQIIVTFKEPMNVDSIAGAPVIGPVWNPVTQTTEPGTIGYQLNTDSVRIFASNAEAADGGESAALAADAVIVNYTDNHRTFVFKPIEPLGSASQRMDYTVKLTNTIERQNGQEAFDTSGANSYYSWEFEVGTFLDLVPPQVQSVYPMAGAEEPRNVVVQINFTEAVDPTATTTTANYAPDGTLAFTNIQVVQTLPDSSERTVAGSFSLANEYRTVEFTSDDLCGVNSCGQDVYCLPASSDLKVVVASATLQPSGQPGVVPDGPTAQFISGQGYDGVIDAAANSLNGNGPGGLACTVAAGQSGLNCFRQTVLDGEHCSCTIGPAEDNFSWQFSTTDDIDLLPPHLLNAAPAVRGTAAVEVTAPGWGLFSKVLLARSVVGGVSATLSSAGNTVVVDGVTYAENLPFWPALENIDGADANIYPDDYTRLQLLHTGDPMQQAATGQSPFNYSIHFTPAIRDIYQNCFFPAGASQGEVVAGTGEGVGAVCNYPDTGVTDPTPACCNAEEYNDLVGGSDRCPDPLSPLWQPPVNP